MNNKYTKNLKRYLKMYLSLATICKGLNFMELFKGIASDVNTIISGIEDKENIKSALNKMKEVTLSDIKSSVVEYIPTKDELVKDGYEALTSFIERSSTDFNKALVSQNCFDVYINNIKDGLTSIEDSKKKMNAVANIFGGKSLHDLFKANRFQYSKSDCNELYIEQTKKVVSNITKLMFIEKIESEL